MAEEKACECEENEEKPLTKAASSFYFRGLP
jgi:hypothetical protein